MALTLALHGKHTTGSIRYASCGGWVVPWRFVGFDAEYEALRAGIGLIDYSTQAVIECRGSDRVDFLQRLLTNDIARLAPGTGCQAALLTPSAKIIAPLLVLADLEALWLLCEADRAEVVAQALERYHFSETVTVTPHDRRQATLALQGPRALALLTQLMEPGLALLNQGDHTVVRWQGVPLRLIRHTLTGEVGVLCLVNAEELEAVWHRLAREGAAHGMRLVGWEALNTARIEAGLPWMGIDMDERSLLPETGLEAVAVSETKGCYIGQEVIARMRTYGSPSKKLLGLIVDAEEVPQAGDRIVRDGEPVGQVTSACRSPRVQRPIAMGYLKRGSYEPGTGVEIVRGTVRLPARVVPRPFTPPASTGRTRAGG